ncbi:ECF transporter S component [Lentilactobacillus hilgardii]|uniref:ECF transporter S component n=1 Tax=Lentilactobacillus hilgardii TaxID=1588 RepID=UPI0021C36FC8|nr:ECF transporter S component [Lentilactobacillus hilgardii]MCP9332617.1 ECF transporter S component [Lentilactobacillus hilgardii]MCP9349224.1 ECF transporter S component [Lentilactobacillus hilgardii]MCP9352093.1 ECF transporter S component [Lentilactobacillus hilgardii]
MDNKGVGQRTQFRTIILTAMFVAVTLAVSMGIPPIPIPGTHGNINLCDGGILISALLLGPKVGGTVGALSGFLLDILSGYSNYAIFSFIVHGLEGLIAGWIKNRSTKKVVDVIAVLVAAVVMVVGYFFADSILYTFSAGFLGIFTNTIQGLVGAVIALAVTPFLRKRIHS